MENNKRSLATPERSSSNLRKRRCLVSPVKETSFDPLKACKKLLSELMTNPKHESYAMFFAQPVDAIRYKCEDYYEVIKSPMDLSTMMTKLNEGKYKDENDFMDDANLIIENCIKYNGEDHPVAILSNRLHEAFTCGFSKIEKLKERAKVSIFDKIDQKEKEIRHEIWLYQEMLDELNNQLECLNEQRIQEKEIREKAKVEKKKKILQEQRKSEAAEKNNNSDEEDTAASMTLEELTYLSQELNKLEPIHFVKMLEIINKYETNVGDPAEEDIEIDFDLLKPITLRELEKFLQDLKKPKPQPRASRGKVMQLPLNANTLKKEEKILKEKLEKIEEDLGMKKKAKPESSSSSSSSSSDDDSSSSSSDPSSATLCSDEEED